MAAATLAVVPTPAPLLRTNTLLMGPVCTGKSWSLRTLLSSYPDIDGRPQSGAGRTLLYLALEPGYEDSLGDCTCEQGFHVHYIPPLDVDWDTLVDLAKRVQAASGGGEDGLKKITDPNKRDYTQFLQTYAVLAGFTCDRCGQSFGPIDKLDESYAVAMDGLTGLSNMATHFCVGLKPSKSWPEYDAIQQQIENLLRKCVSIKASFILVAHIDREPNPLGGPPILTMHTVGNKLAPRLTKDLFSEIVYAHKDERGRFWWSTTEDNMDLKARRLPFSDHIPPQFSEILGGTPSAKAG